MRIPHDDTGKPITDSNRGSPKSSVARLLCGFYYLGLSLSIPRIFVLSEFILTVSMKECEPIFRNRYKELD